MSINNFFFLILLFSFLTSCSEDKSEDFSIKVGRNYKGGIVAYIFKQGDVRYIEGEVHGIIAAPSDLNLTYSWSRNTSDEYIGETSTQIGYGEINTYIIVNYLGDGEYAAKKCYDLDLNGYSDWYLPSKGELNILCANQNLIGGFKVGQRCSYWSSSEFNFIQAWYQGFCSCNSEKLTKIQSLYVRPIRNF
jgi:hypothetical protein